ncbi:MAG: TerC family protein [Planctomycetaceae bacterium]
MEWLLPLITLTAMEIVLGIDNIIFIAILAGRLPKEQQQTARRLGLLAALVTRVLLLLSLKSLLGLTAPVFHLTDLGVPAAWVQSDVPHAAPPTEPKQTEPQASVTETGTSATAETSTNSETTDKQSMEADLHDINGISWRDLILLFGGMFLIGKSVLEVHHKLEGEQDKDASKAPVGFWGVIAQIAVLDIIFSLDSVITAVGMVKQIEVMIVAVVLAVLVMLMAAGPISHFVERHPTLKMLALSFLILIGVLLVAEGIGTPVNKGYIYFAMAFSLIVELLNMKIRGHKPKAVASND